MYTELNSVKRAAIMGTSWIMEPAARRLVKGAREKLQGVGVGYAGGGGRGVRGGINWHPGS